MDLYKNDICYRYTYKHYISDNDEKLYSINHLEINLKISKFKIKKIIKEYNIEAIKLVNGYASIFVYSKEDLKKIYRHMVNKNFQINGYKNIRNKHKIDIIDKYMSTSFFNFASKKFEV